MFGLGEDEDDQRMWNLLIFHTPLTDKEIEDLGYTEKGIDFYVNDYMQNT